MRRRRVTARGGSPPEVLRVCETFPSSAETSFRELDDVFLQTQTRIWLAEVLHIRFDEETPVADLLADGELLFQVSKVVWRKLLNQSAHRMYSKVQIFERATSGKSSGRYMAYPKTDSFLKICQILGLTGVDLFSPSDVVEKRDTRRVCMCIRSLSKKARLNGLDVPDFDIVTYTIAMPSVLVGYICRNLEQLQDSTSRSIGFQRYFQTIPISKKRTFESDEAQDLYKCTISAETENTSREFDFDSPYSESSYNTAEMSCFARDDTSGSISIDDTNLLPSASICMLEYLDQYDPDLRITHSGDISSAELISSCSVNHPILPPFYCRDLEARTLFECEEMYWPVNPPESVNNHQDGGLTLSHSYDASGKGLMNLVDALETDSDQVSKGKTFRCSSVCDKNIITSCSGGNVASFNVKNARSQENNSREVSSPVTPGNTICFSEGSLSFGSGRGILLDKACEETCTCKLGLKDGGSKCNDTICYPIKICTEKKFKFARKTEGIIQSVDRDSLCIDSNDPGKSMVNSVSLLSDDRDAYSSHPNIVVADDRLHSNINQIMLTCKNEQDGLETPSLCEVVTVSSKCLMGGEDCQSVANDFCSVNIPFQKDHIPEENNHSVASSTPAKAEGMIAKHCQYTVGAISTLSHLPQNGHIVEEIHITKCANEPFSSTFYDNEWERGSLFADFDPVPETEDVSYSTNQCSRNPDETDAYKSCIPVSQFKFEVDAQYNESEIVFPATENHVVDISYKIPTVLEGIVNNDVDESVVESRSITVEDIIYSNMNAQEHTLCDVSSACNNTYLSGLTSSLASKGLEESLPCKQTSDSISDNHGDSPSCNLIGSDSRGVSSMDLEHPFLFDTYTTPLDEDTLTKNYKDEFKNSKMTVSYNKNNIANNSFLSLVNKNVLVQGKGRFSQGEVQHIQYEICHISSEIYKAILDAWCFLESCSRCRKTCCMKTDLVENSCSINTMEVVKRKARPVYLAGVEDLEYAGQLFGKESTLLPVNPLDNAFEKLESACPPVDFAKKELKSHFFLNSSISMGLDLRGLTDMDQLETAYADLSNGWHRHSNCLCWVDFSKLNFGLQKEENNKFTSPDDSTKFSNFQLTTSNQETEVWSAQTQRSDVCSIQHLVDVVEHEHMDQRLEKNLCGLSDLDGEHDLLNHSIADSEDPNKEMEKIEEIERAIILRSDGNEGKRDTGSAPSKPKKRLPIKSFAGGITLLGSLFFLLLFRQRIYRSEDFHKTTSQLRKPRRDQEISTQKSDEIGKVHTLYPGERLKL